MDPAAKGRPSFAEVLRRLAALRESEERAQLTPTDDFAVYHGWQTGHVKS